MLMMSGVAQLDLHGKTREQARTAIDAMLRRAGRSVYRIRLIHGSTRGTALRDLIESDYASHPRVLRLEQPNPGATELVLREY